jgi:hypothetical protein
MSARARAPSAAEAAAELLLEYLQLAVNSTLARRGVYPPELFEMSLQPYGVPVRVTRSPELEKYVDEFLDALKPLVCSGAARAVSLVITTEEAVPVERHVFSFSLIGEAKSAAAALADKRRPLPVSDADKDALLALEQLLGEAVLALDRADASLPPLPPGTHASVARVPCAVLLTLPLRAECTFQLEIMTSGSGDDRSAYWLTHEVLLDHAPAVFPPLGPVVLPVHYMGEAQKAPLLELRVLAERLPAPQAQSVGAPADTSPPYEEAYML